MPSGQAGILSKVEGSLTRLRNNSHYFPFYGMETLETLIFEKNQ